MHTLTITEMNEHGETTVRFTQNIDDLDQALILKLILLLNRPKRKPRTTKTN